jgi:hypothetical protein
MRDPCATARFPNRIHAAPITHDCPRGEAGKGRVLRSAQPGPAVEAENGLVCALLGRHGPGGVTRSWSAPAPWPARHRPQAPGTEVRQHRPRPHALGPLLPRSSCPDQRASTSRLFHAPSRLCTMRSISLNPRRHDQAAEPVEQQVEAEQGGGADGAEFDSAEGERHQRRDESRRDIRPPRGDVLVLMTDLV